MKKPTSLTPTLGRPRSFDVGEALQRAMQVFWRKGYEGASIADLTKAMGINSPSLYAAFGNKKDLFHAVVMRYDALHKDLLAEALTAPRAQDVVRYILRGVAALVTDTGGGMPPGSLFVHGGLSGSDSAIPAELASRRALWEAAIRDRFIRAQAEEDLVPAADPVALARHTVAILIGMSVLAGEGVRQEDLLVLAELAVAPVTAASRTATSF